MPRYHKKCICEYDGGNYAGWQHQEGLLTIQAVIDNSLQLLYGEEVRAIGSGRTDSGVHALGQVFHYVASRNIANHSVIQALNSTLPRDIAIVDVADVPESFHAQFSATSKTYKYLILNRSARAALDSGRAWYRRAFIDEARLNETLQYLEGSHDFTSFCVRKSLKQNCLRTVNFINASRDGDYISIRVNAGGFLHNMVRIIVGTAVNLVLDNIDPAYILEIVDKKDRNAAGPTAPPHGLYLERVYY